MVAAPRFEGKFKIEIKLSMLSINFNFGMKIKIISIVDCFFFFFPGYLSMPWFDSIPQELILVVWPLYQQAVYSGRGILLVLGQPSLTS